MDNVAGRDSDTVSFTDFSFELYLSATHYRVRACTIPMYKSKCRCQAQEIKNCGVDHLLLFNPTQKIVESVLSHNRYVLIVNPRCARCGTLGIPPTPTSFFRSTTKPSTISRLLCVFKKRSSPETNEIFEGQC